MNTKNLSEIHLTEQELIDYFQNRSLAADLPYLNAHLLKCSDCSKRLSGLIIFAIENKILDSEQRKVVDDYLESSDYDLFTQSFFRRVFSRFKNKWLRLLRNRLPNGFSITINISIFFD